MSPLQIILLAIVALCTIMLADQQTEPIETPDSDETDCAECDLGVEVTNGIINGTLKI